MDSTDYYLSKQLVQYVSSCLEMRDNFGYRKLDIAIWFTFSYC